MHSDDMIDIPSMENNNGVLKLQYNLILLEETYEIDWCCKGFFERRNKNALFVCWMHTCNKEMWWKTGFCSVPKSFFKFRCNPIIYLLHWNSSPLFLLGCLVFLPSYSPAPFSLSFALPLFYHRFAYFGHSLRLSQLIFAILYAFFRSQVKECSIADGI